MYKLVLWAIRRRLAQAIIVLGLTMLGASGAQADLTFSLDTEFSGATPSAGTITGSFVADCGANCVTLTIDATGLTGTTQKVTEFFFNTTGPSVTLTFGTFTAVSGAFPSPTVDQTCASNDCKADGDGLFDVGFFWPSDSASGNAGLFGVGDKLTVTITGTGVNEAFFNSLSEGGDKGGFCVAAHVQAIGTGTDSGWMGADSCGGTADTTDIPVPEPSALVLLGAGLIAMRRFLKQSK